MRRLNLLALSARRWAEGPGPRHLLAGSSLALGLAAWLVWWPQRIEQHRAWQAAQAEAALAAPLLRETDHPGDAGAAPARVAPAQATAVFGALMALASAQQIRLGKLEVRWDEPADGTVVGVDAGAGAGAARRVQLGLPMQASYPALRRFMQALGAQQTAVTVDQVSIRRLPPDNLSAGDLLEVRLSLSVWLLADEERPR